ncbi:MAG: DUF2798 domain-containing protein [Lachnospiraceae bacterium]|nr:DUF2798 domain-containing protein [Lachnospiraceae bacterium]MCR4802635.1 DUF2798 domain-containing protein [Lachnospiraceae bacterium]
MQKNKIQELIFTILMATVMVYGMVVYNVFLHQGKMTNQTFLIALHELPIMVPIAVILEFFLISKLAGKMAFKVVNFNDRPQFITYAISICICCMMCPIMSFVAMMLFGETKSFAMWVVTWGKNFPMALMYQLFYCGPIVRLIYGLLFERKEKV